jgi:chromosomal replication initiation ATPase DnaA
MMAAIASMKDDWTPAKLAQHQAWRAGMFAPKQTPDPMVAKLAVVAEPKPDISEQLANAQAEIAKIKGQLAQFRKYLGMDREPGDTALRVTDVMRVCAKYYGVSVFDLQSKARTHPLVWQRQIAVYLCRIITGQSFPHIGRKFKKDHTTAMHAHWKIAQLRLTDPDTQHDLAELEALCA